MNFFIIIKKHMSLILFIIISFTCYILFKDNDEMLNNDIETDDDNNTYYYNNDDIIPRIIWLYWDGKMDEEVKYMLHYLKENMNNYSLIFLSSTAMCDYLNATLYPHVLHTLPKANQADYYRFNLLYKYGGIWLDCSTFMKNQSLLDELISKLGGDEGEGEGVIQNNKDNDENNKRNNKKVFFGFNSFFPMPYHIEIGFMVSYPHTEFIKKILEEMEICLDIGRLNYMKKRISEGVVIFSETVYDNTISYAPHYNTFYCFYVCMQTVVQKFYNNNPPALLYRSEEYIYKLHMHCKWNAECMVKAFINDTNNEVYPIIIFTSASRNKMRFPRIDAI